MPDARTAREQFLSVSGASDPAVAQSYLEAEGYDVERALDSYFESTSRAARGPPQQPSPPPVSAPPQPPPMGPPCAPYPAPFPAPHPPPVPPYAAPYPPPLTSAPLPPGTMSLCGAPPAPPPMTPYGPPPPASYPLPPSLPPYGPVPLPPPAPAPPPGGGPAIGPLQAGMMGLSPPPPCGAPPKVGLPPSAAQALSPQLLFITRPVEWANVLTLGMLENANKYKISDPQGKYVARIVEHQEGFTNEVGRHLLGNHRGFSSSMISAEGSQVIFRVRRPAYVFKSEMTIEDAGGFVLGKVKQQANLDPKKWRKHDIFLLGRHLGTLSDSHYKDDFKLVDPYGGLLARVYREWQGVGKEIFTDAGKYVVHFGQPLTPEARPPPAPLVKSDLDVARPLDLLERVAMLAAVISVDFLHFSTSSEPWFKYGPSVVL